MSGTARADRFRRRLAAPRPAKALGRFGPRRVHAASCAFTATCWATAGKPEIEDASTAIAKATAPRNTKRAEIIRFSHPLNGFPALQRRPSNGAAPEMVDIRLVTQTCTSIASQWSGSKSTRQPQPAPEGFSGGVALLAVCQPSAHCRRSWSSWSRDLGGRPEQRQAGGLNRPSLRPPATEASWMTFHYTPRRTFPR